MSQNPDVLIDFVHAGLAQGRAPEELRAVLTGAGWSPPEIEAALSAWLPAPEGLPPVPRPRAYVSAREGLVYGLMFLLLGCICVHLTLLGFHVVNALLPEPGATPYLPRDSIRWSVATLIPTLPLFLWLNARVSRQTAGDPGLRRSLVRKWFASMMLLGAALVLISDLVAVIYAALTGDLTLRFVAKAGLVAVIGATVLSYYREEVDAR